MLRKYVDHGVAAAWGGAEATVCFIVPDLWTTWLPLHNPRRGVASTGSRRARALAGGALNYTVAQRMQREDNEEIGTSIPGISARRVGGVGRAFSWRAWG